MNTGVRKSQSVHFFLGTLVSALFLVPFASQAQLTFFGSGGPSNTALAKDGNLAFGWGALYANTTGNYNTAIGPTALFYNTTGSFNTAIGNATLFASTTGSDNTANGWRALFSNTTGYDNTANGFDTLGSNTNGYYNTANGANALFSNTAGNYNTANGFDALYCNTNGPANTATGSLALYYNSTGYSNTANGEGALLKATGNYNIALGAGAGENLTTGNNNIDIGNWGSGAESGVIRIGMNGAQTSTYIAGISGVTSSNGVEVFINTNGQLGTLKSSRRFKKEIHDMGSVSDKLMQLRPVTFRYKEAAENGTHPLQYGMIAEEVAKVYPDLVQYDKAGKPFTIYYHLLTPMLLNELQKARRQADAQTVEITALQSAHKAEITALNTILQKQSAALQSQGSELAALKQSQQQQLAALAKLTALVQTSQNREAVQRAVYTRH